MSDDRVGFLISLSVLGLALLAGGILAAGSWLPMNPIVGIRLRSTMASDQAWKAGHKAAGPYLIVGGVIGLAAVTVSLINPMYDVLFLVLTSCGAAVVLLVAGAFAASKAAIREEHLRLHDGSRNHQ